ncbi:MAG TPA: YceD family protein [Rhodocyclaceae bacterium]|nr:YceD family protein [Rhodocyclaceae bacterium]
MSHHNASIADPFEFARRGAVLEAEVPAGGFARLADQLRRSGAERVVKYRIEGESRDDKAFLVLQLEADVMLGCQRCLGDVACPVESQVRLLLVREGDELPDEGLVEDDFDPIHASRNLDVLALVEDELLLSLPLAPMHDECEVSSGGSQDDLASPFAVLGKLKRSNDSNA